MKRKFSKHYQTALLRYLKQGPHAPLRSARGLGDDAFNAGLQTMDIATLHEQILVNQVMPHLSPARRAAVVKRAGLFFTEAITPIDGIRIGATDAAIHLNQVVGMLSQRTVELATSNVELAQEIVQRKAAEHALKKSKHHYSKLLEESDRLQKQLRQLSRKILSTQEEERREISRELHDVIAQTLTGINVRLATLKKEAAISTKGLDRNIARTQLLVEKSVDIVHRFARELRPAVLDDLGLIPALHSFVKIFSKRTLIHVQLKVFAEVEQLDGDKRTMFYRVAQEALTNVARHAHANRVEVSIQRRRVGFA
jgi:signal transduction histidine kinase